MDFDQPVARAGTASFKWDHHPAGVIPLWVADMDFVSPPAVVDAVRARAEHGVYGYSAIPEPLVESIIEYTDERYGWRMEADWLVWLPSLVTGIDLACGVAAEPGGAVMTITPVYPPFLMAPATQGCRLLTIPATLLDGRWQLPLHAMEQSVTPDTRSLLFFHPHNPLGRVWEADEGAAIVDFCRRHRLVLCSDEIHCDLLLDPLGHTPAALAAGDALDFTITLMSPSKTFNLPGLNFAFAIIAAPEPRRRFTAAARGLLPVSGLFRHRGGRGRPPGGRPLADRIARIPAWQPRSRRALRRGVTARRRHDPCRGDIPGMARCTRTRSARSDGSLPGRRGGALARGGLRRPRVPAPQLRLPAQHPAGGTSTPAEGSRPSVGAQGLSAMPGCHADSRRGLPPHTGPSYGPQAV